MKLHEHPVWPHISQAWQESLTAGYGSWEDVWNGFPELRRFFPDPDQLPANGVLWQSIDEVRALELTPIEQLCGPLYSACVLMMAGVAGVGKSLFALQLAACIAAGNNLQGWYTPKARQVLYVDGEMAPQYMQNRIETIPESDNLKLIHLDSMRRLNAFVDFSNEQWRDWFVRDEILDQFDVFFFDTVSSLVLSHSEGAMFSPEYWLQLESFHQQFRSRGKTVVWVDNLNKSGEIFGTAVKHHKVDACWRFEEWAEKPGDATAGFRLFQNKQRGDTESADSQWYYTSRWFKG